MRASAMVGMVHAQIKKSETAKLRMNLFLTVRRDGFWIAHIRAKVFPVGNEEISKTVTVGITYQTLLDIIYRNDWGEFNFGDGRIVIHFQIRIEKILFKYTSEGMKH